MRRGSWADIFGRGMGQFVWRYGVLWFGSLFFLTNTLVRWLSNKPDQRYDAAIVATLVAISFVYSLSVGAVFGFAAWFTLRAVARLFRRTAAEREPVPERERFVAAGGK